MRVFQYIYIYVYVYTLMFADISIPNMYFISVLRLTNKRKKSKCFTLTSAILVVSGWSLCEVNSGILLVSTSPSSL